MRERQRKFDRHPMMIGLPQVADDCLMRLQERGPIWGEKEWTIK
jgi:hypothetical protein